MWQVAISDATPAAALRFGRYPLCSSRGYSSCSFATYSQCMETARGLSGHCYQNPAYEYVRRRYKFDDRASLKATQLLAGEMTAKVCTPSAACRRRRSNITMTKEEL